MLASGPSQVSIRSRPLEKSPYARSRFPYPRTSKPEILDTGPVPQICTKPHTLYPKPAPLSSQTKVSCPRTRDCKQGTSPVSLKLLETSEPCNYICTKPCSKHIGAFNHIDLLTIYTLSINVMSDRFNAY